MLAFWIVAGVVAVLMLVAVIHDQRAGIAPPQSKKQKAQAQRAVLSARVVCPHCGQSGSVHAEDVKVKRGISGGKVTGAVLTGGISMLGTGLSRKQAATLMRCRNCGTTWHVE